MNELRVIIAGGRDFNNYDLLKYKANQIIGDLLKDDTKIIMISGAAKGADKLGEIFAMEYGYNQMLFPAYWDELGRSAGPERNRRMAEYASEGDIGVLIAFWNGESPGTRNMIKEAKKHGLITHVIKY